MSHPVIRLAVAALLTVAPISGMSGMAHHAPVSDNASIAPLAAGAEATTTTTTEASQAAPAAQEGLLPYGPTLYGHPIVAAGTPGLPAADTGEHRADSLPADLLIELADVLNHQPDHQYNVLPERITRVTVHTAEDMPTGDTYVCAEVEATDDDGVAWNWTLTVAP